MIWPKSLCGFPQTRGSSSSRESRTCRVRQEAGTAPAPVFPGFLSQFHFPSASAPSQPTFPPSIPPLSFPPSQLPSLAQPLLLIPNLPHFVPVSLPSSAHPPLLTYVLCSAGSQSVGSGKPGLSSQQENLAAGTDDNAGFSPRADVHRRPYRHCTHDQSATRQRRRRRRRSHSISSSRRKRGRMRRRRSLGSTRRRG